jgi:hypothetical protein
MRTGPDYRNHLYMIIVWLMLIFWAILLGCSNAPMGPNRKRPSAGGTSPTGLGGATCDDLAAAIVNPAAYVARGWGLYSWDVFAKASAEYSDRCTGDGNVNK